MATNQTSFVTRLLYYEGPEAFEYSRIFKVLIKRCHGFIDVGANIGYYSLLAAKVNPLIEVVAFEPAPGPAQFLVQNIELNRLTGIIEPSTLALSDQQGEMNFYSVRNPKYPEIPNLGGVGSLLQQSTNREVIKVKLSTLDEFIRSKNSAVIDLIKMDTEGTEDQVLRGAAEVIRRYKPIIICETMFNRIEANIESEMLQHGYHFYNHKNGRLHRVETLVRNSDDGVRDCFMVHPSKEEWVTEFESVDGRR